MNKGYVSCSYLHPRDSHSTVQKKQALKRNTGKKANEEVYGREGEGDARLERPQRYSATSGVEQIPLKKRTWSIPEDNDEQGTSRKKRGSKKGGKRLSKPLGTGVNAIPVG